MKRVQVFFNLYDSVFVVLFWCQGRLFCTHGADLHLPSTTSCLGDPHLSLFLDEIPSCLCHPCQCFGDVVGGHPLCPQIHNHAFFIVAPKDPINEITPTRPHDMDCAHGALLRSASGANIFLIS